LTAALLLVALTSPLWAQDKSDDVDNRKAEISAVLENGVIEARFWDELFVVEWEYDLSTKFTDSVGLSWPMPEDWRSRYRYMLKAMPEMWRNDTSRRLGNPADRPAKYFAGLQVLSKSLDARLMHPLVYMVKGKKLQPYLEVKYLHLFDTVSEIEVFTRGRIDLDEHSFSIGASKEFGSFRAKILWNNFDSFGWSIGYSTVIN
jgi:hypothetical protein